MASAIFNLKVKYSEIAVTTVKSDPLDQVFMSLADGTRREIVQMLSKGEKTISQLSELFAMSMAAVSKHVKVLEQIRFS